LGHMSLWNKRNNRSDIYMRPILTITLYLFALLPTALPAQQSFRIMTYNVENFFDTKDDPAKDDNEFTPSGSRHWTSSRYYHKTQQIAKVIAAAGEWDTPALVGLCEIENDTVLHHLLQHTPLRQQHYHYCMTHGQDTRGINVALLYQRDKFGYLGHEEHPVKFSRKTHKSTRNILHSWGKVVNGKILDVFVCHLPSRYGGEKESETDRTDAARTLRQLCDSLHTVRDELQIIIMGDFNDTSVNASISKILNATPAQMIQSDKEITTNTLFFLKPEKNKQAKGSYKFQGEWSCIDQIIVSANLIRRQSSMHLSNDLCKIFSPSFLLTDDKTWRGKRPYRSFYGYKYEGGYSDHLPIIAEFYVSLPN